MTSEWRGTFADKLRGTVRVILPPWFHDAEAIAPQVQETFEMIREAEVFNADNIAEYLYGGTDQEVWTYDDFPCVAPPFQTMFIEYKRPSRIVSEVHGEVDPIDTAASHTGWLLTASERPDGEPGWLLSGTLVLENDEAMALRARARHGDENAEEIDALFGEGVFWPGISLHYLLRADGSIESSSPPGALYSTDLADNEKMLEHIGSFATTMEPTIWPVLLALTFVNCKNVPRRVIGPPPKLVKRDKKRKRESERKSYHVLDIGPMKRVLYSEGGKGKHGSLQQALHVCRGHFKTYDKDAPLFGRHVGTWWWAPTLRGTEDEGTVEKDYRVLG